MTDEHSDRGRAELIAARHQVTTFVEGLLDVLEELAEAEQRGVSMTQADEVRLRAGIATWRAQVEIFKTRLHVGHDHALSSGAAVVAGHACPQPKHSK